MENGKLKIQWNGGRKPGIMDTPEIWNKSRSVLFHIEVGKEDNGRVGGQENENVPKY